MTDALKRTENRLRRQLYRDGYLLRKSRSRDPSALDYGLYAIIDPSTGGTVHAQGPWSPHRLTLDEVAAWLSA